MRALKSPPDVALPSDTRPTASCHSASAPSASRTKSGSGSGAIHPSSDRRATLAGPQLVYRRLPRDRHAARVLHDPLVVPLDHAGHVTTPLRQVVGQAQPALDDVGPGLLECEGQSAELPGELPGVGLVRLRSATSALRPLQQESRRVFRRQHVQFQRLHVPAPLAQPESLRRSPFDRTYGRDESPLLPPSMLQASWTSVQVRSGSFESYSTCFT